MSSRSELAVLMLPAAMLALILCTRGLTTGPTLARAAVVVDRPPLRVCADPNNLPFSNDRQEGFENRIARVIASDLGRRVEYTWWPQRRGFVRNTLRAGVCDVVMGVPSSYELTMNTVAYYRSTYVFVTRTGRGPTVRTFDDRALRHMRIGIHMMGDDYANSPAATALMHRGLGKQIVPFMIYGDYNQPNPPARLLDAVARGEVDVAVVWGPLAGSYAQRSHTPLTLTPVLPHVDLPFTPFVFDIAMGVRRGDSTLRAQLDTALTRHRVDIRAILRDYGVPVLTNGAQ